ncbi:hypothetical protein [Jeotgalibacillus haloalkalitolerans]|uniref:Uncharacterized protein n=1 Tax=Jeotgalibacillus haloalkalitolerans TaxID=3104292 RepID=A0ABU5KK52_9BACL|nr:hypothetical protein [Jeotgalibacillus sp. HH7-29]MDZ5711634.1 hypothetical protein [Jeotgalibacillus sp. HH7-29]
MTSKLQLIHRTEDLHDICATCELVPPASSPNNPICSKCPVQAELQQIGKQLLINPKIDKIVSKGRDMSVSEMKYLVNKSYDIKSLKKILKMGDVVIRDILNNNNISVRGDEEMPTINLTTDEYMSFIDEGLSINEMAERKGLKPQQIYNFKSYNNLPSAPRKKKVQEKSVASIPAPVKEKTMPLKVVKDESVSHDAPLKQMEARMKAKDEKIAELEVKLNQKVDYSEGWVTQSKYKEVDEDNKRLKSKIEQLEEENHRLNHLAQETDRTLENERFRANDQAAELVLVTEQLKHAKGLLKAIL